MVASTYMGVWRFQDERCAGERPVDGMKGLKVNCVRDEVWVVEQFAKEGIHVD